MDEIKRSGRHFRSHDGGHANPHPHPRQDSPRRTSMPLQQPVRNAAARAAVGVMRPQARRRPSGKLPRVAIFGLAGVVVLIGLIVSYLWLNRRVDIEINGVTQAYAVGTSAADIVKASGIQTKPGNLVSVSGKVLTEGKGQSYALTINDKEYDPTTAADYKIGGGEKMKLDNGKDIMEEYTSKVEEVQPKLRVDGKYGAIAYVASWPKVGQTEIRTGKISGETAQGEVKQKGSDLVIRLTNIKPDNGEKVVAITFDDGPSKYTERYLKILSEKGVHATFFNIGENVASMPQLTKECIDQGHQVLCHSWDHPDFATIDAEKVQSQLNRGFKAIKDASGEEVTAFRPPYGSFRLKEWLKTNGTLSMSVLWNQDTEDWKQVSVDSIVQRATTGVEPGSIILMHDGGGPREMDLEALPKIIDILQQRGYKFVTLSELLATQSDIPANVASLNDKMPEGCTWPTEIAS